MAMTKPTVPPEVVLNVLVSLLGPVTGLRRLTEGMESQAFSFRREGQDFVIRINRNMDGFLKDRFAHDRFATGTRPIPEVIDIGPFVADYAYCVSRLCPGITLQEMPPDALPAILVPTADVLAAIAASNLEGTSGFGPWDSKGRGRYDTWREFVLDIPEPGDVASGMVTDLVPSDRLRSYVGEIRHYANAYPEERQLIHGDFGSNNVLTDGRGITGVIDWSESMYGDPLYDIANVFFWRTWLPCMEAQARYFEQTGTLTADTRNRLRCYALRIGLMELIGTSSATVAQWATTRCDQILAGQI